MKVDQAKCLNELEAEGKYRVQLGWRRTVAHVCNVASYSERRVCRALGSSRNSVRYQPKPREDETALTDSIIRSADQFGRYGYRRIHTLIAVSELVR